MAPPVDNPFDVTDEVVLAQECVVNCRRKFRYVLYSILIVVVAASASIEGLSSLIVIVTLIASVVFAVSAILHGVDYWLKFRRTGQGLLSVTCRMIFCVFWLLLIAAAFLIPVIGYGLSSPPLMKDTAEIREAGIMLFTHANENNGKYPDDLEVFIKTELSKANRKDAKTIKRLFYKKGGKQPRWILTSGLTTNDSSDTIVLQSAEKFEYKDGEYLIVYTCGNSAFAMRNPDQEIIVIDGKPVVRRK